LNRLKKMNRRGEERRREEKGRKRRGEGEDEKGDNEKRGGLKERKEYVGVENVMGEKEHKNI
jgi:hypothetical protein